LQSDQDGCLWTAPNLPEPRNGAARHDIGIIGGGLGGLAAALQAARQGASVLVVDAGPIGGGAAGRNGGQVLPGLKVGLPALRQRFGEVAANRLVRFADSVVDRVEALVEDHHIACAFTRAGWYQPVHAPSRMDAIRARYETAAASGAPVRWLDRARMAEALGTTAYLCGWTDPRAATVQPAALVHGMAEACLAAGVTLLPHVRISDIASATNGYELHGDGRSWHVTKVVVATHAGPAPLPELDAGAVSLDSAQVATHPLPEALRARILPCGGSVSDSRRSLIYWRLSPDGRLVVGGRGGIARRTADAHFARLRRIAVALHPDVATIGFSHAWSGRVVMTADALPRLHEPLPGIFALHGCNGRGIAMMIGLGGALADRALGVTGPEALPLPVTPMAALPLAPLRRIGAALVGSWFGWRDRLDSLRPSPPPAQAPG